MVKLCNRLVSCDYYILSVYILFAPKILITIGGTRLRLTVTQKFQMCRFIDRWIETWWWTTWGRDRVSGKKRKKQTNTRPRDDSEKERIERAKEKSSLQRGKGASFWPTIWSFLNDLSNFTIFTLKIIKKKSLKRFILTSRKKQKQMIYRRKANLKRKI